MSIAQTAWFKALKAERQRAIRARKPKIIRTKQLKTPEQKFASYSKASTSRWQKPEYRQKMMAHPWRQNYPVIR